MSWLRRILRGKPEPKPKAPAWRGFDAAIAERSARYEELRKGLLSVLFVKAKLEAEAPGSSTRLRDVERRVIALSEEMARCKGELDELRLTRLDTAAEIAFTEAL
jgi:hypothetical protein